MNQLTTLFSIFFMQNNYEGTTLEEALKVYAEFDILVGQAVEWSKEHSFKCNYPHFCQWASCYNGLLCTMVCKPSLLVPGQYLGLGLHSRGQRGRPSSGDKGEDEEWETTGCRHRIQQWGLKNPQRGPLFFKYFFLTIQGKETAAPFQSILLWGHTIAIITWPMCQACTCSRVRAQGPTPSAPKQWKLDIHLQNSNPVSGDSAWESHWRNPRKTKLHRESNNINARVSVHWRAQNYAIWPMGSRVSAPCRNRSHVIRLTTKPCVGINLSPKTVYDSSYFATLDQCFAFRIVIIRLLKLNTRVRQDIPEFLTANLLSIHIFASEIDLSWNNFSLHNFCSETWNLGQILEIKLSMVGQ